jgi:hypothetical protein
MNNLYRFFLLNLCVVSTVVLAAGPAMADVYTFTASLSGANEVPPVATTATGFATIIVDTDAGLVFPLHAEFSGLSSSQTGAHIHTGAAGVNGPVVFASPLGSPIDTMVPFDIAMYANLAGGAHYYNVHTQNFPAGEIRGQFLLTDTVDAEDTTWGSIKSLYR